jgi:hypothetical protein
MRLEIPKFRDGVFGIAVHARSTVIEVYLVQTLHWHEHLSSSVALSSGIDWQLTSASGIRLAETFISSSC